MNVSVKVIFLSLALFFSLSAFFIITEGIKLDKKKENYGIDDLASTGNTIDENANLKDTPTPILTTTKPAPKFCISMPVLMYHHIQPEERAKQYSQESLTVYPDIFETQLKYLKDKGYKFLDAKDLVNAIINQTPISGKNVVITIDDGYSDSNEFALEIAEKYKAKLNIFIPTSFINKGGYLSQDSIRKIKSKDNDKRKYALFYNHSVYHRDLRYLSFTKVKEELTLAQDFIEHNINDTDKILAYPYGFYNENVIKAAKDAGFKGAFGTEPGSHHCDTNLFHLPRIRIRNTSLNSYGL